MRLLFQPQEKVRPIHDASDGGLVTHGAFCSSASNAWINTSLSRILRSAA
jgi:hypothetical protein